MSLLEKIDKINSDCYIREYAVFCDKDNNIQLASIRIVPKIVISIKSFNLDGNDTGYMNICFHPKNRLFLDTIYCYDKNREKGVATNISLIADYLLQDYQDHIIRGVYEPSQLSTDRDNHIERSIDELHDRADSFYNGAGYKKIYYRDYKQNHSKYPTIDPIYDFKLEEELAECIVIKKIGPNLDNPFTRKDGIITRENVLENLNSEVTKRLILRRDSFANH